MKIVPFIVPFGNPALLGLWYVCNNKPGCVFSTRESVIPCLPFPSKLFGSFNLKAIPTKFDIGANVI